MRYFLFSACLSIAVHTLVADWSMYLTPRDRSLLFDFHVSSKGFENVYLDRHIPIESCPTDLVVSPDGAFVYLLYSSKKSVLPINVSQPSTKFCSPIAIGKNGTAMAIASSGKALYVVSSTENCLVCLTLSSDATLVRSTTINVGLSPLEIICSLDGSKAYVCNYGNATKKTCGSISCVDTAKCQVTDTVSLSPYYPFAMVMHPDGSKAYVLASIDKVNNQCVLLSLDVSGTKPVVRGSLNVACSLTAKMAISPSGDTLYLTNQEAGTLLRVDIASGLKAGTPIYIGRFPVGLAITPDSNTVYVALSDEHKVVPLVWKEGWPIVGEAVATGMIPDQLVISADMAPSANFTVSETTSNVRTLFSAESSFSPTGSISYYKWDFGDGCTSVTKRKQITHIYEKEGTYTVTLTVINSAGTSLAQRHNGKNVFQQGALTAKVAKQITVIAERCR